MAIPFFESDGQDCARALVWPQERQDAFLTVTIFAKIPIPNPPQEKAPGDDTLSSMVGFGLVFSTCQDNNPRTASQHSGKTLIVCKSRINSVNCNSLLQEYN